MNRLVVRSGSTLCRSGLASCSHAALALPCAALRTQRRYQFYTDPSKRDQEAFLATYDPLAVLGLDEDAHAVDVHAAFERLKAVNGSKGTKPNAGKMERIDRAYALLTDTTSPYYSKAHASDRSRHRMQIEMMPKDQRKVVQFQMTFLVLLVCAGFLFLLKLTFLPMQKGLRAATR